MVREGSKQSVLGNVFKGGSYWSDGRAIWTNGVFRVHVRFCSDGYKFNINRNTLLADYECWICGSAGCYYLIPIAQVESWYEDPSAYPDTQHAGLTVVSVDATRHEVAYARGGIKAQLANYYRDRLP